MPAPRSRLSDVDRDRLAALLREHFAQGLLDIDELRTRLGVVLAAEFADEAEPAVGDLPPLARPPWPAGPVTAARPRGGRHAQAAAPDPGWLPTQERFRDPTTGRIMRVWIDPADQGRHYVPEPES